MAERSKTYVNVVKTPESYATSTFAGLAAVALAIIGLAGVFPRVLLSTATIALGAALMFHAGTVAARFSSLSAQPTPPARAWEFGRWGGMTIGFLAGATGIALGILSLLNISPMVLTPIAAMFYGASLIMDSGVNARLVAMEVERSQPEELTREVAREHTAAASGVQVLAGLAAIVLGIIALVSLGGLVLSLVAILSVAASLLVSTYLGGGRLFGMSQS